MEFNEILKKEQKILRDTSWGDLLRLYIYSSSFTTIIGEIVNLINEGIRFSPTMSKIFKPFIECDYEKCNVIILNSFYNEESYIFHEGLCLDTRLEDSILNMNMFKILKKNKKKLTEHLASQNILCLNDILAIPEDERRERRKYKDFLNYFFEVLYNERPDILVVEIGSDSGWKGDKITLSVLSEGWNDANKFFLGINEYLKEHNKEQIKWD